MNVDECVRYSELAMVSDEEKYAENIEKIDDDFRVRIFRNKDKDEIEKLLKQFSSYIKKCINEKYYNNLENNIQLLKSSNDNKKSADLYHILPNKEQVDIELKFGSYTNKNIGMKKLSKIFGFELFEKALDRTIRKQWREQYIHNKTDEQQELDLVNQLNKYIDNINESIYNKIYDEEWNRLFESSILNITGDGTKRSKHFLLFQLDDTGFKLKQNYKMGIGDWKILPLKKIKEDERCHIYVVNDISKMKVDFCLNWKNNYKIKENNMIIPAKLGLGCPSWNVWIKDDNE